jgi:hypothetical protein
MKGGGDEGQAATELALVLPLLVVLLLAAVQVTLIARDQILVVHAAREAAREAAVDRRPGAIRTAAIRSGGLKPGRVTTETSYQGGSVIVIVRVEYRAPTDVAIVGPLLPDVRLRSKAAMRVETPTSSAKEVRHRKKGAGTAS